MRLGRQVQRLVRPHRAMSPTAAFRKADVQTAGMLYSRPAAFGQKRSWGAPSAAICYPALALDDRTNDWKPPYAIRSASNPEFEEFTISTILGSAATFSLPSHVLHENQIPPIQTQWLHPRLRLRDH